MLTMEPSEEHGASQRRREAVEINGYALKAIRVRSGLNQSDFAHEAGISRAYLSNLERGARCRVRPSVLAALIRVLLIEDRRALLSDPHAYPAGILADTGKESTHQRQIPQPELLPIGIVPGHTCDTCPANKKVGSRNLRALSAALRKTSPHFCARIITSSDGPIRLILHNHDDPLNPHAIEWHYPPGFTWANGTHVGHPVAPGATLLDTVKAISDVIPAPPAE